MPVTTNTTTTTTKPSRRKPKPPLTQPKNDLVHSGSAKSRPSKPSAEQQQDRRQQTTTTTTTDYKLNVTVEDDNDESVERFKLRSSGQIVIAEGTRVPLWCKVKSRSAVSWLKDQFPFFDDEMIRADHNAKRFNFIGNITENDYSIELVNAQVADSGKYWCQISPYGERSSRKKSGASNNSEFIAETILTVTPAPVQTLSPIAANSLTTADQNGSGDHTSSQQHGHYISPLSQTSSSSSTSDNNLIGSSNYLDSFSSSKSTVNNNKAREAVPNTAIKLSNGYLSPAPYNYNQHHHSTVRASTIPTNSPGLLGGNGSGAGMHSVALIWPYLLLVLAALLMLANVYLIFSLIKRHTRCSKEDEANEEHDNDDPSLA